MGRQVPPQARYHGLGTWLTIQGPPGVLARVSPGSGRIFGADAPPPIRGRPHQLYGRDALRARPRTPGRTIDGVGRLASRVRFPARISEEASQREVVVRMPATRRPVPPRTY